MTDLGPEPRPRAALETMPSYLPGRPAPAQPERDVFKVSSNENPYPPLASVRAAIDRAAGEINRYPDMASTELTAAIADTLGVEPAHVVTGTGSVGVLGYLVSAMCDAGDEVVYAWRSFEAYPIICAVAGATAVPVPLATGGRHDLPAMAAAVTPRTRVVIVCTPNNPTGAAVRTEELERFLAEVPAEVLVAIDEAYVEFNRDPAAPDVLELWRQHANVVVLRTFSKAYGLAGLRVGYALAHPQVAAALRKTAVPFGVSSLAQAAAVASLAVADELFERVEALVSERRRVESALAASGWSLPASEANFVWFPLGRRSAEFRAACEEAGLVVRQYGDDGVRVTIAEPVANDRLVHVAADWLASRS